MTLDFCFSGWVSGAEVERVYETGAGRELLVEHCTKTGTKTGGIGGVRLIDVKTQEVIYDITLEEFKDRLQDGRFTLDLAVMLDADCHKSEREIFDIDDVQV